MSIIGWNYGRILVIPKKLYSNSKSKSNSIVVGGGGKSKLRWNWKGKNNYGVVACSTESSSESSSSNLLHKMERAWLISQQPKPVACCSCESNGHVECKWCGGTGFFILGDNMLCQVPSRNTTCIICSGKGSACCSDCKGTGFRAKWLEQPPMHM